MMKRRIGGWTARCLGLQSVLLLAGCGTGDGTIDAIATDTVAAISIDSTPAADTKPAATEEDPFRVFGMSDSVVANATTTLLPLWLINRSEDPIVVEAAGGAGSVVVDTVSARDSTLVRIETRATRVELEARSLDGASSGTSTVVVTGDTVRVAFPL